MPLKGTSATRHYFQTDVQRLKIFFQGMTNFFQALKKLFQALEKYFQGMEIFLKIGAVNFPLFPLLQTAWSGADPL